MATGDWRKLRDKWNTWQSKITGERVWIDSSHISGFRPGIIRAGLYGGSRTSRMRKVVRAKYHSGYVPGSPEFSTIKAAVGWLKEYMATHHGVGILNDQRFDPVGPIDLLKDITH